MPSLKTRLLHQASEQQAELDRQLAAKIDEADLAASVDTAIDAAVGDIMATVDDLNERVSALEDTP